MRRRSLTRAQLWSVVVIVVMGLLWLLNVGLMLQQAPDHSIDFDAFYAAAQALRFDSSVDIYSVHALL